MNVEWWAMLLCLVSKDYITPETAFYSLDNGPPKGNASTLNDDDTSDMIAMRLQGMMYKEIGELYGLDTTAVFNRIKRRYIAEQKEKAAPKESGQRKIMLC